MKDMVFSKNKNTYTTTLIIADGVGNEHKNVIGLLRKYSNRELLSTFETAKVSRGGRPVEYAILSEEQTTFLITLMSNSDKVVSFKEELTKAFYQAKKALLEMSVNKSNQQWLSNRDQGKLTRKGTTDIIQKFTEYAVKQGSKNAERYYGNISKMENSALFMVMQKFPNLRDVMNNRQLNIVQAADTIVQEAIREGMEKELFYKEIYQLAKTRVNNFAEYMPRTSIPMAIGG